MADIPVSCHLTDTALRERLEGLLTRVLGRATSREWLGEGLLLTFTPGPGLLEELAEVIELERRCCPFLTFRLEIGPGDGPITLALSGPPGTAAFLETELHLGSGQAGSRA